MAFTMPILSKSNSMFRFFRPKFLLIIPLLVLSFSLSGCGFRSSEGGEPYKVSLEIWGVFDDSGAYNKAITEYKKINPHVGEIQYRKLSPETYKEDLINALAAGKGPDIFMIRNAWREPFEDKTAPAPEGLITERVYREAFVDVVSSDFIGTENKIYGIPLSVDSLALYYNKDMFNAAGISRPPETWGEVMDTIKKLTILDQFGNITRSGIALGTGANINRSSDILTALMLQSGVELDNDQNRSNFFSQLSSDTLDYYTQFSRIGSPAYTWNARQHYSIDSFYEGTTAMMINYSWQYETLKQKNAKLNIGIAPLPQMNKDAPKNVANYWGYAVTKDKPTKPVVAPSGNVVAVDPEKQNYLRVFEAWQFLKFMALSGEQKSITLINGLTSSSKEFPLSSDLAADYLAETRKPAARRDLIASQKDDLILAPFAYGNLIARNWYQGNPEALDGIVIDAIESVIRGEKGARDALSVAANRIEVLSR